MTSNFHLFGLTHLCILAAVLAFAALLTLAQRKFHPPRLRLALAFLTLTDAIVYHIYLAIHGRLTFPAHLPLELCDLSLCLILISLFTLSRSVFDLAYYYALAGATMALLTPNLWEPFPSFGTVQFFIDHGLIVASTLYLVWSGQIRPRPWSVLRAIVGVNLFAALVGSFDAIYQTNYMYLRHKPQNPSLLDLLGPWPWYLVATEPIALAIFLLLYLPFRKQQRRRQY